MPDWRGAPRYIVDNGIFTLKVALTYGLWFREKRSGRVHRGDRVRHSSLFYPSVKVSRPFQWELAPSVLLQVKVPRYKV